MRFRLKFVSTAHMVGWLVLPAILGSVGSAGSPRRRLKKEIAQAGIDDPKKIAVTRLQWQSVAGHLGSDLDLPCVNHRMMVVSWDLTNTILVFYGG